MAPSPLNPTTRYYPPGVRRVYWMPTTANYNAPTRSEINAGVDLTNEVESMTGWSLTAASVQTPDLGHRFISEIPGALSSSSNDIVLYQSQNSNDARTVLTLLLNGYIIVLWEGDVSGQRMDVFPVRVMAAAPDSTTTDPAKCTFSFSVTGQPAIGATIP